MNDKPDRKLDLVEGLFEELGIEDEKRVALIMQAPQLIPQLEATIAEINRKLQIARDFLLQCDEKTQNFEAHKAALPSVIGYDSKIPWRDNTIPSVSADFAEWLEQGSEAGTVVPSLWEKIYKNWERINNILSGFQFSSERLAFKIEELEGYRAWLDVQDRICSVSSERNFCRGCKLKESIYGEYGPKSDEARYDEYGSESYLNHQYCDEHGNRFRVLYKEGDRLRRENPHYAWTIDDRLVAFENYANSAEPVEILRATLENIRQRESLEPSKSQLEIEPVLDEMKEQIILLRDTVVTRLKELEQELIKRRTALDAVLAAISG